MNDKYTKQQEISRICIAVDRGFFCVMYACSWLCIQRYIHTYGDVAPAVF
ncbi:unnamed protein product [Periconia digitata]|uniref:Uncharacterized protein n=1 Tax=Periconia digitata TaxID=1303443 RepID=A0A9W4UB28_9PLEO|nr:unnamed protein product [Periconia digitata]